MNLLVPGESRAGSGELQLLGQWGDEKSWQQGNWAFGTIALG